MGTFVEHGYIEKALPPIGRFIPPNPQDGAEWAFPRRLARYGG